MLQQRQRDEDARLSSPPYSSSLHHDGDDERPLFVFHHIRRRTRLVVRLLLLIASLWSLDRTSALQDEEEEDAAGRVHFVAIASYLDQSGKGGAAERMTYAQCFATTSDPGHCCQAVQRAMQQQEQQGDSAVDDTVYQTCLVQAAAFPEFNEGLNAQQVPRYSFFFYGAPSVEDDESTPAGSWCFPPVPAVTHRLSTPSDRFLWDDRENRRISKGHAFIQRFDWLLLDDEDINNKHSFDGSVRIQSVLSNAGGMHRDLRHQLTFDNQIKRDTHTQPSAISMIMMLHIPADLFVNVEDLFRVETDGLVVQLVPMKEVVDQEEPVFVSPPHGLLVEVTVEHSATLDLATFEFVTKLHVRYPLPFSNQEKGSTFRLAILPPPLLLSATRNDTNAPIRIFGNNEQPPLLLWVAAGHQDDYPLMLGITLLVALGGAILMLRDISRVAEWE